MTEVVNNTLMAGKRGLVLGIANDHSIAYGIARALHGAGAELALTYQAKSFLKRVGPIAESLDCDLVMPCDVTDAGSLDALFAAIEERWGGLDFLVHAIAYSDRAELSGRYVDTTRDNFVQTLSISCFSFTDLVRRASVLMPNGGSMVTLSFLGAHRVMPSYNVMGVAKAALETSVRYLAEDLGKDNIRINAISAGPMRTLAGAVIADGRHVHKYVSEHAPLRDGLDLEAVGNSGLYLLSDLSSAVTGEVMNVDNGFSLMGIPRPIASD
ncbi:MAG: SDR family oxidoreductase [Alphaproteobacteria bacterium]|jgi:enoyl-[acyl-carrier protein] reductase I|nr:enoyl-[acyl-carrier-protein] reductase FabI [Rhodospirillaceae bacterium]MDP6020883.1 SDR family oxidoreductase [Alphaproteobacteria bacterium]MDP6254747.1 SDR family oxidoreductase [Alphaproteobacteria bacterium]MDP7054175.1 SDR family oxidoreductase [Alphaproteobacteria bacterium]MDP7231132.1 SDR family oxidoreductase [Alphaproteobacteria bacterium]|tara:strand:- start:1249 stop:2055 length:807 start_codon:yes stop_codon:yes gene_type:complete